MKKILFYLTLVTFNITSANDIQHVISEVSKVKPNPNETSISRKQYDQKIQSVAESLAKSIQQYANIHEFILDATGSLYPQFTIGPVGGDLFQGLMGSEVSIVHSPRGVPIGILKVYPHDFRQFAEEVWAFTHLNHLKCDTLRPPHLYGIGASTVKGKKVLMTFQEYATGETLDDMVKTYMKNREGFTELCQAYYLMGKALAELHQSKVGAAAPMHPIFKDSAQYYFTNGIKYLKSHPEYQVDIQKFSKKYQTLFTKIRKTPHHYRYSHFDVHGGNYKVNLANLQVWILDLEPAAYSIASQGEPIGVSALDYVQAIENLRMYKIWGLEKKDYKTIRNSFKKGYQSVKRKIPERDERDFYALLDALIYLDFYYSRIDSFSDQNKKLLKEVVDDRMIRVRKLSH